mgnify:CR=1 FL=1
MTEYLINFAINFISTLGYAGVFFLMAIESLFVPFPSEITMTFSGFLTTIGKFNFFLVVVCGTLGNLAGATVGYYIGRHLSKIVLERFIKKYGKFLFITGEEFTKAENLFKKHGIWIITIARFLPGVRAVISLPAGASKIPYTSFIIFTAFGSIIWSFILTYAGVVLGTNWQYVRITLQKFDLYIILVIIFLITLYFYKKLQQK